MCKAVLGYTQRTLWLNQNNNQCHRSLTDVFLEHLYVTMGFKEGKMGEGFQRCFHKPLVTRFSHELMQSSWSVLVLMKENTELNFLSDFKGHTKFQSRWVSMRKYETTFEIHYDNYVCIKM
jgi:hypothetical protein